MRESTTTTENAFGTVVNHFRVHVLEKYIHLCPTKCTSITNACIVLYNFLLSKNDVAYTPAEHDVPLQRCHTITHLGENRSQGAARDIRDEIYDFVNTNRQVEWQWDIPI